MTLTEFVDKLNELKNDSKNADKQIYFFTEDDYQTFDVMIDKIEIEDKTDALWAIADDLRDRKNQGEFVTFIEGYRWGERHYTQNGNPITAFKLQRAYHKAKSEGIVD